MDIFQWKFLQNLFKVLNSVKLVTCNKTTKKQERYIIFLLERYIIFLNLFKATSLIRASSTLETLEFN